MIEALRVGNVECDFVEMEEFLQLCSRWLQDDKLHHVVTLNAEMVMMAQVNQPFRQALERAEIRVPDSAGLLWARWYLRSHFWALLPSLMAFLFREINRVSGVDIVRSLTRTAFGGSQGIYLLGGAQEQAAKTAAYLKREFPRATLFSSSPHTFDLAGPEEILTDIAARRPAILFVAYGAPGQTMWIEEHRAALQESGVKIAIGVGGAFAIISEELPRAPRTLRRMNLEWLWRLILEPRRLPRIWTAVVRFPRLIHNQKH